jgi:uncharacterized membrane protein YqjE
LAGSRLAAEGWKQADAFRKASISPGIETDVSVWPPPPNYKPVVAPSAVPEDELRTMLLPEPVVNPAVKVMWNGVVSLNNRKHFARRFWFHAPLTEIIRLIQNLVLVAIFFLVFVFVVGIDPALRLILGSIVVMVGVPIALVYSVWKISKAIYAELKKEPEPSDRTVITDYDRLILVDRFAISNYKCQHIELVDCSARGVFIRLQTAQILVVPASCFRTLEEYNNFGRRLKAAVSK